MSGVNNLSNPGWYRESYISSFYDNEDYQGGGIFCFLFRWRIIIYLTRVAPREIFISSLMIINESYQGDEIFYFIDK